MEVIICIADAHEQGHPLGVQDPSAAHPHQREYEKSLPDVQTADNFFHAYIRNIGTNMSGKHVIPFLHTFHV